MSTQFVQLSEGRIAYDEAGSGPLVVCVPGMGDLRDEYRSLAPQLLAAGYRVVTMDVRGHGESSVGWKDYSVTGIGSDILDLIRNLNAGPAVIIGNSMAAGAAVIAAAEAPELVKGLVLLGPAVRGEVSWIFRLLLAILFARPWGPSAWLWYYRTLFPTRVPDDYAAYAAGLKRNLSEPGRMEALHEMMIASKAASAARLSQVNVPTLALMGTRDPDFKDPTAENGWIAAQLRATGKMIEGAGHYPQTEMPEITGSIILEFLKTLQLETEHVTIEHS